MAFSEQQLEDIRERVDLPAVLGRRVTLRKAGKDFVGLCPFHGERTPSFNVVPGKQMWHCFGCGESGDVFKFFMKLDGLGFMDAVRHVAREGGFSLDEEKFDPEEAKRRAHLDDLAALMERAVRFYEQKLWHPNGRAVQEYVKKRGVSEEFARKFHVGFGGAGMDDLSRALNRANASADFAVEAGLCIRGKTGRSVFDRFHGRLITPIRIPRPPDGRSIGLGGRYLPGITDIRVQKDRKPAKYLNSPETPLYQKSHVLFGLDQARDTIRKEEKVVIVEGYFDVIGVHQAGLPLAVATCGTSLTPSHLDLLTRSSAKEIIFLFDGDEAGIEAAKRAAKLCASVQVPAKVATLPTGMDPDDYARQRGLDGLKALLDRARPAVSVLIDYALNELGPNAGVEERIRVVNEVREVVLASPEGLARDLYYAQIAERLHVSDAAVREAVLNPVPMGRTRRVVKEALKPQPETEDIAPPEPAHLSQPDRLEASPVPAPEPAPIARVAEAQPVIARQTQYFELQITHAVLRFPALVEDLQKTELLREFSSPVLRETVSRVIAAVAANQPVDALHLIAEISDSQLRDKLSSNFTLDDSPLDVTRRFLDLGLAKMNQKVKLAQARAAWLAARRK